MSMKNYSASYVTRRCLLVEDGGCGRVLPAAQFQRRHGGTRWGYLAKCSDCREPYTPEQLEQAGALFEAAAPMTRVVEVLDRAKPDAGYVAARRYGWSYDKRRAARRAARLRASA